MVKKLLLLFFCSSMIISRGQTVKDDSLQVIIGIADTKLENLAAFHRICSKLQGVKITSFCLNHSVFYLTAPRNKYESINGFFLELTQRFTLTPLYLKTGSSYAPPSDCEAIPPADEAKLIKLINEM